jgi:hypothetical protein
MDALRGFLGREQVQIHRVDEPEWKQELVRSFRTHPSKRDEGFRGLLSAYLRIDQESPRHDPGIQWNAAELFRQLFRDCLVRGEVKAVSILLANQKALHIPAAIVADGWDVLRKAMPAVCAATELKLSCPQLGASACRVLFDMMQRMPALNSLILQDVQILEDSHYWGLPACPQLGRPLALHVVQGAGIELLLPNILKSIQLCEIDLERCPFSGVEPQIMVAKTLFECQSQIRSLRWSAVGPPSRAVVGLLIEAAKKNDATLTDVSMDTLFDRQHGPAPLQLLSLMMRSRVRRLNLAHNAGIPEEDVARLVSMLEDNNCLESLNLCETGNAKLVFERLADALVENTTLTELSMSWNPGGARRLLEVMEKHNTTLLRINFLQGGDPAILRGLKECLDRNEELAVERRRLAEEAALRRRVDYVKGGVGVILKSFKAAEAHNAPDDVLGHAAGMVLARDHSLGNSQTLALSAFTGESWARAKEVHERWEKQQEVPRTQQRTRQQAKLAREVKLDAAQQRQKALFDAAMVELRHQQRTHRANDAQE